MESDSKNALSWVSKKEECPRKLRFYGNKITNILLILKNVSFVHINREANDYPDALAKEGSHMEGTWITWP